MGGEIAQGSGKTFFHGGLQSYLELERRRKRRAQARWAAPALALALLLAFPPARRAAAELLDLLRTEKIQVIPLSEESLAQMRDLAAAAGTELSRLGRTVSSGGELTPPLPPAEAESRLGFRLPLPVGGPEDLGPPVVRIRTPAEVRFTLDAEAANEFIRAAGGGELLPPSLDGRTVALRLEAQAVVEYPQAGVTMARGPAPAWEGVGAEEAEDLKRVLLSLPGLPPEVKIQLAALEDPRKALFLPAPAEAVREVEVRGRTGFFLSLGRHCHPEETCPRRESGVLLWMEEGMVNLIGGRIDLPRAIRLASSLP